MDLVEKLRPKRKALVTAAESVATGMFEPGQDHDVKKAQLNHLIGVCGEATCAEEVENYIRYQAGRRGTGWTTALAKKVIAGVGGALTGLDDDRVRVEAWRLYAIFLTRSFTYQARVHNSQPTGRGDEARGEQRNKRGRGQ